MIEQRNRKGRLHQNERNTSLDRNRPGKQRGREGKAPGCCWARGSAIRETPGARHLPEHTLLAWDPSQARPAVKRWDGRGSLMAREGDRAITKTLGLQL